MSIVNAILVGLREIWAHKFRSLLTMMGIILGVSSLIAMSALVKGMENGMKEALIALGGLDKVLLREQDVPAWQGHLADQAPGRTMRDVLALKRSAPLIKLVSPEMELNRVVMERGAKRVRPSEFVGVWPEVIDMNLHVVEHGRFFTDLDEEMANNVCVIGTAIRDQLFGSPEDLGYEVNPVGELVNVNGLAFTIIGMFERYESERERKVRELAAKQKDEDAKAGKSTYVPRGRPGYSGSSSRSSWAFERKNNTVYIPLNTMWVKFRSASGEGGIPDPKLTDIDLKVVDLEHMDEALTQARNVLMFTHNGIEDFYFSTQENSVANINTTIRNARVSGGIISAISLLVGGIGIMNIMLASITERVREIGIRKAVGATTLNVFTQIIVESVVIAVIGGLAGLAASFAFVQLLIYATPTDNTPVITPDAMLLAFSFSVGIGIVAGLFPAFKASRLHPIQALRYE
ncbi:MAG: ABC transporter permease [Verrucomicrobiota bacterium]